MSDSTKLPPFDQKEIDNAKEVPNFKGAATVTTYDFPVTPREAYLATYRDHDPMWIINDTEYQRFEPSIIPDNCARGFVEEAVPFPREKFGGKDMFGIEWVYVDVAGGSMVKPGEPYLTEISEWHDKLVWPDVDSWDWDGSAKLNKDYLDTDRANLMWLLNGCWFERLISFMDFQYAAMALVDEDDVEEVKELTHELTTLYMHIVDNCCDAYDKLDGFEIHDDWGSQKSPFFSEDVGREVYLPEMKRFVDHVHSKGKFINLHSCGHIEDRADIFVEAGFDGWIPMAMNDSSALYDKYGDKMVIAIVENIPENLADYSEEDQIALADEFVEKYTKGSKVAAYSYYSDPDVMTPAFRAELYKQSRIRYAE